MGATLLKTLAARLPSTNPKAIEKEIIRLADGRKELVDVGCCGGTVGKRLVDRGFEVTGIDWDTSYLQEAMNKGYHNIIQADLTKPLSQIKTGYFPIVLASEIIEHMPDDKLKMMVSELHRICDGYLVATVPNCEHLVERFMHKYVFSRWTKELDMGHHYQQFTQSSFEDLLVDCGFEIEKSKLILFGADIMVTAIK